MKHDLYLWFSKNKEYRNKYKLYTFMLHIHRQVANHTWFMWVNQTWFMWKEFEVTVSIIKCDHAEYIQNVKWNTQIRDSNINFVGQEFRVKKGLTTAKMTT